MPKRGIVMVGQSNGMAGYAEDRVDAFRSHPNMWQFKQDRTFQQAPINPLDFTGVGTRAFTSYAFYLVRDYLIPRNPGVDFCILPQSVGGTNFSHYWHAPSPELNPSVGVPDDPILLINQYPLGGYYLERTIAQMNAFLAAEAGNTIDMVILQNGEQETGDYAATVGGVVGIGMGYYHDTFGLTVKQAYIRYVQEMVADITARVTGGRTWSFLIGQVPPDLTYAPGVVGPSACGHDHHNSAYVPFFEVQKEMPAYVSNCGYIDTLYPTKAMYHDGIKTQGSDTTTGDAGSNGPDGQPDIIVNSTQYYIHYNQAAMQTIAHRANKAFMKLKNLGVPVSFAYGIATGTEPFTPLAPSLDLADVSDTGVSLTDNITRDPTPNIICTFNTDVLENDIIRIRDGVVELVGKQITAADISSLSIPLGLSPLPNGAHNLTARHERGLGVSPYSSVLTFTVDTAVPVITTPATANVNELTQLALPLTVSGAETVTWTETLDTGNHFQIFGSTLQWTSNGTKTYNGTSDTYTCEVKATDLAGNEATKTIAVTVLYVSTDIVPPVITTPSTANVNEGVVLVVPLTANELVSWTLLSGATHFEIAGTTLRWLGNGVKTYTGTSDSYVATVRAIDTASLMTDKTITVTVLDVVAATPPTAPILDLLSGADTGASSTDNITMDATPSISVTYTTAVAEGDIIHIKNGASDLVVTHTITAGEVGLSSMTATFSLTAGTHSLTANHERGALIGSYGTPLVVTVDYAIPAITTGATASVDEGLQLAIALTVSSGETVTWSLTSGGADFEISGTTLRWLGDGTKTYVPGANTFMAEVAAEDVAGNADYHIITVTVLSTAPVTTRSFGAEGVGVTVTIGGIEFGAEGLGIVES